MDKVVSFTYNGSSQLKDLWAVIPHAKNMFRVVFWRYNTQGPVLIKQSNASNQGIHCIFNTTFVFTFND